MRVLRSAALLLLFLLVNLVACMTRGPVDVSFRYEVLDATIAVTNWAVYAAFAWFLFEVGRLLSRLLGLTGVR